MEIPYITRPFYPDELRVLRTMRTKAEKEMKEKPRYHYFLVALVLAVGGFYLADLIDIGFFRFVFAAVGVIASGVLLFGPYEMYKLQKNKKAFSQNLNALLEAGTVATCTIHAKRIAYGPEREDENDIYVIEYETGKVLYLWDSEYNLGKKFPCLHFEIYEERYFKLLKRQIYPLSERIEPIKIDKEAKWKYMGRFKDHLETETIDFDKLLEDINTSR